MKYHLIEYDDFGHVVRYQKTPKSPIMLREHVKGQGIVDRPEGKRKEINIRKVRGGNKEKALEAFEKDLNSGQYKLYELAAKYGISKATASNWKKALGR